MKVVDRAARDVPVGILELYGKKFMVIEHVGTYKGMDAYFVVENRKIAEDAPRLGIAKYLVVNPNDAREHHIMVGIGKDITKL